MTNDEAIKYLIKPFATSTRSYNEYLKQREAYDLAIKALKRPQGKWIKITKDGVTPIEYVCSNCGRTVKSHYEDYFVTKEYPFCHCGADMRGAE